MFEKILIVDDNPSIQLTLEGTLKKEGYEIEKVSSAEEALNRVKDFSFDIILLDVKLPGMSGIEAIPRIKEIDSNAEIIVITAHGTRDIALEAISKGAYDYFTKPFSLEEIRITVGRAFEKKKLQSEVNRLRQELKYKYALKKIIGQSESIKMINALVERLAPLDTTVLITGESGTGKELIADTIHSQSKRSSNPFVKLNCAAIPEGLLESELFGYERGAFTGAQNSKHGKFEIAHTGTIFLDEVGDMSLATQAKLLRVLEERKINRLGGNKTIDVDIRIIAATNHDLLQMLNEKKFREDLYYRLNVASIHLPPLRERKEDIPLLADHFIQEVNIRLGSYSTGISPEAMEYLLKYPFPGNIRELHNLLERAIILGNDLIITSKSLQMAFQKSSALSHSTSLEKVTTLNETIENVEKSLIINALQKANGIQIEAAKILGINPKNLWKKIKKHGIKVK
ncbi:MAG: sigma-54 dependent transcriptional regulator [Pseudomonadota bacterium]